MEKSHFATSCKCKLLGAAALSVLLLGAPAMATTAYAAGAAAQQQDNKVTGVVKDATGEPIIGASVMIKGSAQGTITDFDGKFSLTAKPNQVLVISYVGFSTQEVKATNNVNVILQEDAAALDEVVVMGYGAAARKQDLSASVGIVSDVDKLAQRAVTSTEAMLQGQLPGVTVTANGGDPTSTPSIVIRGQGSQNGDNVLWVVDGVPGAPIPSVNDIESIVVLKDAASAAIYGATSGAGGCVLVTTKKAQKGATSLTYEGVYGVRQAAGMIHSLNAEDQIAVKKQAYANAGASMPDGWDVTKNPWVGTTRTDWVDEVFRNAFYQRHNVVLNTGTDAAKNRISYSYDGDNGVLRNTYNNKHTIHYNGSFEINKWVSISEDFTWRSADSRGANTSSAENGVLMNALHMPSSATVHQYNGLGYGGTTTEDPAYVAQYGSYSDIHGDVINPVRLLEAATNYNKTEYAWSTTTLQIHDIIPGLKFTSRFTMNVNNHYYKYFTPGRLEIGKIDASNGLQEQSYRYNKWMTENTLTYDNTFGKHTVGVLLSTTADKRYERGFSAQGSGFTSEQDIFQYFNFAANTSVSDYLGGPDANVALVGRLAYSYDDRYFVTASMRRDYAGRLPKAHNYGDFPAVTAAWKVSNEKFWEPVKSTINLFKIRASWGRVGNLGSIRDNYKSAVLGYDNDQWHQNRVPFYGQGLTWGAMYYFDTALNNALTWETSEQLDFGIDLALLNNRLSLSVDYFNKNTKDLIQTQSIDFPSTIGIDPMLVNLGKINNKGVEVQATWSDKINKDFNYFVTANFAWLKNNVVEVGTTQTDSEGNTIPGFWLGGGNFKNLTNCYRSTEGQPLNSFYLIKTDGIFKSDADAAAYVDKNNNRIQPSAQAGDLKFVDKNGDGLINDDDRQYCGNAMPKTTFSVSGGFTWKNLSVSAMLQGVGGAKAMNVGKCLLLDASSVFGNGWDEIKNAWSPSNTGSNIPRLTTNDTNKNFSTTSDWYLEDASYLRLKNLTIGYDLSDVIRKSAHLANRLSSLYVYVSGENLFTITNYTGMDPECGGWDTVKYPVSRAFSFGVKLTY